MNQNKHFSTLEQCKAFEATLPPCSTKKQFSQHGVTLSWEQVRVRLVRQNGAYVYPPVTCLVFAETPHCYLIRNHIGSVAKVNRHTLMSGTSRFELV